LKKKTSRAWRQDDGGQTRSLQHLLRPNLDHVGSRGRFPEYGMSQLEFFSRPKKVVEATSNRINLVAKKAVSKIFN